LRISSWRASTISSAFVILAFLIVERVYHHEELCAIIYVAAYNKANYTICTPDGHALHGKVHVRSGKRYSPADNLGPDCQRTIDSCVAHHMGLWTEKTTVKHMSKYTLIELAIHEAAYSPFPVNASTSPFESVPV
ncbi:MAG: hypothetical protein ABFD98_04995, partial [Syntrophobacteraceae bacterium]